MLKGGAEHHAKNMKGFVVLLVIVEIIIIVLYGVFVRFENLSAQPTFNADRYPAYQDINVMMLIGFGYLMAFSRSFSWSAVSYTFFVNAILVQLYVLLHAFWKRVIVTGFNSSNYYILINEGDFTLGLYSAASMFINLGCCIGRIGPLQTLIICLIHQIGYALNQIICLQEIKAFDVGGSMVIHAFGAYGGLTVSMILSRMTKPVSKPHSNYFSNLFAFIGALFLWMYWPSFNFGVFAETAFTKTQIISNTILSLTGSCLGTFATSAYVKAKFTMEHLLNASLAGGVVIGATAGLILQPGGSLAIGFLTGIVSTICYHKLTPYLQQKFGIYDTCGVHNLHGIPGLMGGIISAIVAATFKHPSSADSYTITNADFPYYDALVMTPYKQGGLQIAATFISIGIAIITALIGGIFLKFVYSYHEKEFYTDEVYFEQAEEFISEMDPLMKKHEQGNLKPPVKVNGAEIILQNSAFDSQSNINNLNI